MIAAIARELPGATVVAPEGGFYVWVTLPPHMDGDALAARAAAAGVNIIPGSKFFASAGAGNARPPRNHIRLSYSYAMPEQIDEGMRLLASVYEGVAA
jgi:2-aminoadipate transaminase